jgi:hypothetical protein
MATGAGIALHHGGIVSVNQAAPINVRRTVLASMDTPYAVTLDATADGLVAFAASEMRNGASMMFKGPEWSPIPIATRPGGCMGVVPLGRAGMQGILMIEDFFPIFQSDASGAALYTPSANGMGLWNRRRLFDLPFLHRVGFAMHHGRPLFIASQLCRSKRTIDDWSKPGAIYKVSCNVGEVPWRVDESPLLDGLHRNHGLLMRKGEHGAIIHVAADEGILVLRQPVALDSWIVERVIDEPSSDLWMADIDGDGVEEIVSIHPFHGDKARIYKRIDSRWQAVWEVDGAFGHVVWSGQLRGRTCLLLGWREERKNLELHILEDARSWKFRRQVLDEGVAPLNAVVHHGQDKDLIMASLGTTHEVVLYTLY